MAARFVMSAPTWDGLDDLGLPEVAIVGRSNVGKSSLLGMLLGQERLVRTSRTPGRTQLLNLFCLDERLALVDLPGYGFAKLPKTQRRNIEGMVFDYLRERGQLCGVLLLVDSRRETAPELDVQVVTWLREIGRPVLIAFTKIDLIPKTRRLHRVRALEKNLSIPPGTGILCSAKTGEGKKQLMEQLLSVERQ